MKKILATTLALGMLAMAGNAMATNLITNGDFETGDLTGWTSSGDVTVVNPDCLPLAWAAEIQGMDNNFAILGGTSSVGDSVLSQDFSLTGATSITLSFNWAFDYIDLAAWSGDDTFLAITSWDIELDSAVDAGVITWADMQSGTCFGMGAGAAWGTINQTFALDPLMALSADMIFSLSEVDTSFFICPDGTHSIAGIDNVSVTATYAAAPVPEPATMLLFGTGLIGLVGYRRRKNTNV